VSVEETTGAERDFLRSDARFFGLAPLAKTARCNEHGQSHTMMHPTSSGHRWPERFS
jgi:hypothetical protein